jgi:hypothetical protein
VRSQDEFRLQCAVADLMRWQLAEHVVWFAVPNGEHRSEITGARLKRMGTRRGVADFHLTLPPNGRSAFLELKTSKGRQSPEQLLFQIDVQDAGGLYAVAHGYDEAKAILEGWGAIRSKRVAA